MLLVAERFVNRKQCVIRKKRNKNKSSNSFEKISNNKKTTIEIIFHSPHCGLHNLTKENKKCIIMFLRFHCLASVNNASYPVHYALFIL